MIFTLAEVVGICGLFLLLVAFVLNHKKKFKRFSYTYNGLNLIGASMLAYYAYDIRATVFLFLQIIWVIVAFYFIVKKVRHHGIMTSWEGFAGEGGLDSDLREYSDDTPNMHSSWFK